MLKHKNAFYCSHTFSLLAGLPIIVLIQWSVYIALVSHIKSEGEICPGDSSWEKIIVFAVSCYILLGHFLCGIT